MEISIFFKTESPEYKYIRTSKQASYTLSVISSQFDLSRISASMARVLSLILFLLFLSVSSLSLISASHFEGFDSDEASLPYEEEDLEASLDPIPSASLPTISLSSPLESTPETEHDSNPSTPPENPNPNPTPTTPSHLQTDFWDEDEFEGIPSTPETIVIQQPTDSESETKSKPESSSDPKPVTPAKPSSYWVEIVCVSFLICFIINYFTGRKENETTALAWAAKFATKDSIFEKNFSLLGTGDGNDTPLLLKEGQDVFKFYASGRR